MKYLLVILFFVGLVSCLSKEEKFIQAEYDKMEGYWVVNTFTVSGNITDELKNTLKTGEMLLHSCKYSQKRADNRVFCGGGDFQINEFLFILDCTFNYETKLFAFELGRHDSTGLPSPLTSAQKNIFGLIGGDWDVTVTGNQLTAKQVTNKSGLIMQLMFTATKK